MPRGYRCIVAALVGWLALCGAQPPTKQLDSAASAKKIAPTAQATATPAPAPTASPNNSFTAYPGYDPDPCYHAKNHDTADLCAQWRASIAAEKAATEARRATNWSIVATFLSALGLGFIVWSLRQTEGALGEARRGNRLNLLAEKRSRRKDREAAAETVAALEVARRSADASDRMVLLSAVNAERELRAYLDFERVDLSPVARPAEFASDTDRQWVALDLSIKNFGRTPAEKLELTLTYVMVENDRESLMKSETKSGLGAIVPSDRHSLKDFWGIQDPAWELIATKKWFLKIRINVAYADCFGKPHHLISDYITDGRNTVLGFIPGTRSND